MIQIDGITGQPVDLTNVRIELDYAGRSDSQPVYIGYAAPGTLTSSPYWKIARHTYDGSDRLIRKEWAEGTAKFTHAYDDRATLSYS